MGKITWELRRVTARSSGEVVGKEYVPVLHVELPVKRKEPGKARILRLDVDPLGKYGGREKLFIYAVVEVEE